MSALLCVALLAAVTAATPETKRIDAQCKAAARLEEARRERSRFFADVSNAVLPAANDGRGQWRELKTRDELKALTQAGNTPNTQASLWSAPDGTTIAEMYFQSDSGDWSQDVDYCFRADGTLARLTGALSNYATDAEGERTIHFDAHGAVLATTGKAHSVESHEPLPTLDGLDTPPIYPTIESLPFLAATRRAGAPAAARPPVTNHAIQTGDPVAIPEPTPEHDEQQIISEEVRSRLGHVKGCYERELAKTPGLAGRIVMRWTLGSTGTTRDVTVVSDDLHAPAVTACVQSLITKWHFEYAPKTPMNVEFPFVFQTHR